MDRRHFLRSSLSAVPAAAAAPTLFPAFAGAAEKAGRPLAGRPLAVTDWTIGARAQFAAFDRAAEIGLDGIQVSFHPEPQKDDDYDLRKPEGREALQEKAASSGVAIASTAMGVFNRHPFKSIPEAVEWAKRGVEATAALEKEVMLMAFFGKNDLKDDAEGAAATIERLRQVAPVAEDHGVILGLETTLSGEEHLHILESVDSPAVQVTTTPATPTTTDTTFSPRFASWGTTASARFTARTRAAGSLARGTSISPPRSPPSTTSATRAGSSWRAAAPRGSTPWRPSSATPPTFARWRRRDPNSSDSVAVGSSRLPDAAPERRRVSENPADYAVGLCSVAHAKHSIRGARSMGKATARTQFCKIDTWYPFA